MPSPSAPPPPPPDAALRGLLPPDVRPHAPWRHDAGRIVWYGVVWGRLGRGDLAVAHLDRVRVPELMPWIAAERGRIVRELGLHAEAEALEWPALLQAADPVDEVMLRISLAADAVGQGDVDRAGRRLAAARQLAAALDPGPRVDRQRLRLAWVGVEVALLTGSAPDPDRLPRWDDDRDGPVLPDEQRSGSRFHLAKGLLFGGVVHGDARLLDAAAEVAPPVLAWAVQLARADAGRPGAELVARSAWSEVVAPPAFAALVAGTPTARRLAGGHPPASGSRRPSSS